MKKFLYAADQKAPEGKYLFLDRDNNAEVIRSSSSK